MKKTWSGFTRRIVISKSLGFVAGLLGFFMIPYIWAGADSLFLWGILFWYTTFGAIIGLMGVMDHHPLWENIKFPDWFRGIFMGSWLNFVLVFFTYDKMEILMEQLNCASMTSPWWFVLEGAIFGLIIDVLATKYGGEGKSMM